MITYDYLVQKINNLEKVAAKGRPFDGISPILRSVKEEALIREAISAEDAVISAFGESVLSIDSCGGMYFFEGVKTNNRYVAIQVRRVHVVSTGQYEDYAIRDIRSNKEGAEQYMKQFPDEQRFNTIESFIIDDPRNLNLAVPEDEWLFFMRISEDLQKVNQLLPQKKDVFNITVLDKIGIDCNDNYCVTVSAKDEEAAIKKGKQLIQQCFEKEEKNKV